MRKYSNIIEQFSEITSDEIERYEKLCTIVDIADSFYPDKGSENK